MQSKAENRPYRVLVTGVGAIIGYGVIKSLRSSGLPVYIVGMDIYEDAVGQHWCDRFIQAKYAVDPEYIPFLRNVIKENQIDIVFFGTEQEIYRTVAAEQELGEDYHKLVLNRPELLTLSKDKWLTREFLIHNGLGEFAIPSVIEGEYEEIAELFGEKFLLKPRSSYASKGIEVVQDKESFDFYKKRMGNGFMAQKLVGDVDHEYTVGVFGLGDGSIACSIAMKRRLSQEGATAKAEIVMDDALDTAVRQLCRKLRPVGPMNLQFRYDSGKYLLLEINPRISSSTSLRTAFGYNEAMLCVEYFLNQRVLHVTVRRGRAVRYIDDMVVLL